MKLNDPTRKFVEWAKSQIETQKAIDLRQRDMLAEHSSWQTFVKNGTHKKRAFVPDLLRGDIADDLHTDNPDFKAARERIEAIFKAIQATRLDYEDRFDSIIKSALAGEIDRRRCGRQLNQLNATTILRSFRDGLQAGGVELGESDEMDAEDLETIADLTVTARGHVKNLLDAVYKDETVSPAMADQKPAMWFTKSILPAYYDGYQSAASNQMMEFAGDDGEESCPTCVKLKGQRHRLKDWKRVRLRPGVDTDRFECNGFRCKHLLVAVSGKARGTFPRAA